MKIIHLAVSFLLLFTTLVPSSFASKLEDDSAELIDGYTPAEVQRNAQRKALGMPPIPPRAQRKKPVKKLAGKVGARAGGKMTPFSIPNQSSTGYIAVHEDNVAGPLLGYLNAHRLVQNTNEASAYKYKTTGSLMEIHAVNSDERMCVTTGLYGQALGLGKKNFHMARHTRHSTAEGAIPYHDRNAAVYLETTVYSIDSPTGEIGVAWVNPDGSHPPIQIALREERLYYTGDFSSFRDYLGDDDAVPVVFKWIQSQGANL
ncbi:hypothetical protein BDZ94DRAFT_1324618 [Collybia nuda]|uniref:Secreted protein n=1 Tax=Collybia nuda TaxID=64659 RepID=A0A9P5Y1L2_9AGAR|nr:hypothetical protein BDZ94DRAFT_1324618 [Collybia nuda]